MATKEQNLNRLDELARILGREPDISGSAAEIAQRVAEWEEEAEDKNQASDENERHLMTYSYSTGGDEMSTVRVLKTLHVAGKHPHDDSDMEIVVTGMTVRVDPVNVAELVLEGLVTDESY